MKLLFTILCICFLFFSGKAQYTYEMIEKDHAPSDLKKDIDFVQKKLEKEHPNLYWYIEKAVLDKKFDSLFITLNKPLRSVEFNAKLLSVLSCIGDGHLITFADVSKLTPAEIAKYSKIIPPVYQFEYKVMNNRLYIAGNQSKDETIVPGTEILSIDHEAAANIISNLTKYIPSDGFNTTFKYFLLNSGQLPILYRSVYGRKDTITFELKQNNITRSVQLKTRPTEDAINAVTAAIPAAELKFLTSDNNVAYLKVPSFLNNGKQENPYGRLFATIKEKKSNTLILDLRGNLGGEFRLTANFLTYLIDAPGDFVKRPDKLIKGVLLPPINKIRRQQVDWYKSYNRASMVRPDSNNFKGKIYVLTDGGSFSAASLLAASLQATGKAVFVGEETGGGRNGCTAGLMQTEILPESKLTLKFGIIPLEYISQSNLKGRGVMPDISIGHTIENYLAKKDPELEWVMKELEKNNTK